MFTLISNRIRTSNAMNPTIKITGIRIRELQAKENRNCKVGLIVLHTLQYASRSIISKSSVDVNYASAFPIPKHSPNPFDKAVCVAEFNKVDFQNYSEIMEIEFSGKRVLVTGAGQGIGRAVVKKLIQCKAHVIAISKTSLHLESLRNEYPSGLETVCVDLSDWGATKTALEKIGAVDLLVNNAAITSVKPFLEITPEDIDGLIAVNVKAVINVSQVVVKGMLEGGKGGAIVNVSSKASLVGLKNHTVYCACKSALDSITRVMALEFGPHKIRVNSVNPTVVMTEMGRKAWGDPSVAAPVLNRIPLGKFADEDDVVHAILYLLSDKAGMTNGVALPIDGGFLAC